jgi:hypothetical protein
MKICSALLDHGYHGFSLTILEICAVDDLMAREKHYFGVYDPEYNTAKTPGKPYRAGG